ncbi:hypothetical protein EGW08_010907 [Elysia chlorotica]|uniref:Methyltransferase domain-containing protein n=1 Tax=Elysia chlorotica TaxID=188477 RepID=A0A3S0ZS13_ELYCH|nr:hypothetical protein EGW08_010907 [Elysia chlorotica]
MFKHGCEVHSFDPSMLQPSYQRNESSWFHNLGLSSRNTDSYRPPPDQYVKAPQVWQMRTLTSVKEMLGHTGRVIDLLKIDIEGFEWDVVENMRETGELELLRQFSLEFHLFPKFPPMEDYVHLYKTFTNLREEMGFAEFSAHPHPKTLEKDKFNLQGDSQFVNTLFRYPPAP